MNTDVFWKLNEVTRYIYNCEIFIVLSVKSKMVCNDSRILLTFTLHLHFNFDFFHFFIIST